MAKGLYSGMVVGGAPWEMVNEQTKQKMTGFTYKVLTQSDVDEVTQLAKDCTVVNVSTKNKDFDKRIGYGAMVEFDGEFKNGYNGNPGKMSYTGMRLAKGAK